VKSELQKLARHRLERARGAFFEGDHLLAIGAFTGAVNRFYYAAFYAARALLATREKDSSRHSGVISLFQAQFVKTGTIPSEKARALPRAFEKRQKSDYGDFSTVTQDEAESIRSEVWAFLEECESILSTLIAEP
jgi:uncharacterized protein (UPF0332 family)